MEYWTGFMNWPIDPNWACEICGENHGLTWGLVHAECRCNNCHAIYYMRDFDKEGTRLTIPKCIMQKSFIEPAKKYWSKIHRFLNDITKEDWIIMGVPESEFVETNAKEEK